MRTFKYYFFIFLSCFFLNLPFVQAQDEKDQLSLIIERGYLLVGTSPDYAPREFYIINADGKKEITGSDIDLARAIADKIGVELRLVATDFNGVLSNIQIGTVDMGISGFSYTEGRKQVMDFSIGYAQESGDDGYQTLLMTKNKADYYQNLEELKADKIKIGAQAGTIQYELAMKLTDVQNIKQYATMDAQVLALNSGDLDAIVVASSAAEPLLESFSHLQLMDKHHFNLDPHNVYGLNVVGLPKVHQNERLLSLVNQVIEEAITSGQMTEWDRKAQDWVDKMTQ